MRELLHSFLKWCPPAAFGAVVAVSSVWPDARDLIGKQASLFWPQLGHPWVAISLITLLLGYGGALIWTSRKPAMEPAPQIIVHSTERDPVGDMLKQWSSRPSPERVFEQAMETLEYVVNAKELWWSAMHSRGETNSLGSKLTDAIDAVRRCFPPAASGDAELDAISRLHRAAYSHGSNLGYARAETERLRASRAQFYEEFEDTKRRFREYRDRPSEAA